MGFPNTIVRTSAGYFTIRGINLQAEPSTPEARVPKALLRPGGVTGTTDFGRVGRLDLEEDERRTVAIGRHGHDHRRYWKYDPLLAR
ncbi:hypothetical protein ACFL0M_01030 [Thermodesulfobacteriota bacterium]